MSVLNAYDYAFGVNPGVSPLVIQTGSAAGTGVSLTLVQGQFTLPNGAVAAPISTTTPLIIGIGSNAETVTPTAVSNPTPSVPGTCVITVTISNNHLSGDFIASGSAGLVEAINVANKGGGGLVAFGGDWIRAGGSRASLTGYHGFQNVTVLDWAGISNAVTAGDGKSWFSATNGAVLAASIVLY